MSNPVAGVISAAAVPPSNPYRAWLGGLAIALNALALLGLWLSFGSSYESSGLGTLLLISGGSTGTLFLLAWLVVGALTWLPPRR